MVATFFFSLTDRDRTGRANRQLGGILAFIAGATNAGGFLAVQRYTSHMTGIISSVGDDIAIGNRTMAIGGIAMVGCFMLGAICTTLLVNWARRRKLRGEYALSLMLEAWLLLLFGLIGAHLQSYRELFVPMTVLLLCFIMGLQNALITKISKAEIRTTHMTGVVTDLAIEIGRLLYVNRQDETIAPRVVADRQKLLIHLMMLMSFLSGAIVGAFGFRSIGFAATLPFATILMVLSAPPLILDTFHTSSADV
jgi:uncharacterized membrane protein YoaK (UPF0700 family)